MTGESPLRNEFFIRRATAEDHAAWLAMRQALWPECPYDQQVVEIAAMMTAENEAAFIAATSAGERLGFVEASIRQYVDWCETRPVGYVEGWYVRAEFRRLGVGRALVAAAELWATSRGCVEIASDAHVTNTVSLEAHQKLGFLQHEAVMRFRKRL